MRAAARAAIGASPASFAAWTLTALWLLVPMPAWFGRLTFLQWSPWHRARFVFGLSSALLSALLIAELTGPALPRGRRAAEIAGAAVFLSASSRSRSAAVPGTGLEPVDRWNHLAPIALTAGAALAGIAVLKTVWGPAGSRARWALPLVLADVGVHPARPGEAHVFFASNQAGRASCRVDFLSTLGGLRRLFSRAAQHAPVVPLAGAR